MNRPLLLFIINYYCAFTASHGYRLVKKRQLIIPSDPSVAANIENYDYQHRLLSKSNQVQHTDRRIVVLAGPHKTASSSIQNTLYNWTSATPQILTNWVWPLPPAASKFCKRRIKYTEKCMAKAFYPLVDALTNTFRNDRPMFKGYNTSEVISLYQDTMESVWRDGHNLLIATEALDRLVQKNEALSLDNFLNTLPLEKNNNDENAVGVGAVKKEVTIVVKFRAPRVEHLVSFWHQCCMKSVTFMEFLATMPNSVGNIDRLHALDSLKLSEIFLKRGLNVILIDMSGIARDGHDISNVVACDVLNANCTETEELVTVEDEKVVPLIENVKAAKGDIGGITEDQMNRIDKVIREYDCNYRHVLEYDNLTVLYNYKLDHIMADCTKAKGAGNILSREKMAERIKIIALDK